MKRLTRWYIDRFNVPFHTRWEDTEPGWEARSLARMRQLESLDRPMS